MAIENVDTYNEYLTKLEAAADMSILNFKDLIEDVYKRQHHGWYIRSRQYAKSGHANDRKISL